MSDPVFEPSRLYLVTPPDIDLETFPAELEAALQAGDVAAVLIAGQMAEHDMAKLADRLVPLIQAHGAAALIEGHNRVAGRSGADGVHVSTGASDLEAALESLKPQKIVGGGAINSRHAALDAGESGVDYVFFGKPHGDIRPEPHKKNLKLAEWWCEIVQVPAVVMAGNSLDHFAEAAATGADFIALHQACWAHPGGPADAVARALEIISASAQERIASMEMV